MFQVFFALFTDIYIRHHEQWWCDYSPINESNAALCWAQDSRPFKIGQRNTAHTVQWLVRFYFIRKCAMWVLLSRIRAWKSQTTNRFIADLSNTIRGISCVWRETQEIIFCEIRMNLFLETITLVAWGVFSFYPAPTNRQTSEDDRANANIFHFTKIFLRFSLWP